MSRRILSARPDDRFDRIQRAVEDVDSLRLVPTGALSDRILILVEGEGALYRYDHEATDAEDSPRIVEPDVGGGRWFRLDSSFSIPLKTAVQVATTAALSSSSYDAGTKTLTASANGALGGIDGVTLSTGARLLVKNQSTASQNGIYVVTAAGSGGAPWVLTRAQDFDSDADIQANTLVFVREGTTYADTAFLLTENAPTLAGSKTFTQFLSLAALTEHLDGGASKHDATEIDYERSDASRKNIQGSSDHVEAALTDLDDATGALSALTTTVKTSVVAAINEVDANADAAAASASSASSAAATAQAAIDALVVVFPMAVYGVWAVDGDGARGNGGGLTGAATSLVEASTAYAVVDDGGSQTLLSTSGTLPGYGGNYQLFPTAPANNDAVYFGAATGFCELAFDVNTAGTYSGNAITWEYWNGSTWSTLLIAYDNTNATTRTGARPFTRDGAITFAPPGNWAATTVNGQNGYWIRARVSTSASLTGVPTMNNRRHEVVSPASTAAWVAPCSGTVVSIRANAGESAMGTTNDTKFILMNYTTGLSTAELTWTKNNRAFNFNGLSLAVTAGNLLGVLVTQEDGTLEHLNVMLEVGLNP